MSATILPETELKAIARKQATETRRQLHADHGAAAAEQLARLGREILGDGHGRIIAGYYPVRSEIDVLPLMWALEDRGWVTALPEIVARDAPLVFRRWRQDDPLVEGLYGIPAPAPAAELVFPDVVLAPMLAFDRQGYRLGYGGGFYDRTLEMLRLLGKVIAIGAAFAGQETDSVPRGDKDEALHWVLTEAGAIFPDRRDQDCEGRCG